MSDYDFQFLDPAWMPEVHTTFVRAFADYAVDSSAMTLQRLVFRGRKNGLDPEASVVVHHEGEMVGFTLVGVEDRSAFDIVTGIVPEHRGKGLAGRIFDAMLPVLESKKIDDFYLEVLQVNERAVKAYEKAGFSITRSLDCFEWDALDGEHSVGDVSVVVVDVSALDEFEQDLDWTPSWENSFASIRRIADGVVVLRASIDARPAGILVYCPEMDWIMSVVVRKEFRRRGVGTALFSALRSREIVPAGLPPILRLINVESSDEGMKAFLKQVGCKPLISQYEMRRVL